MPPLTDSLLKMERKRGKRGEKSLLKSVTPLFRAPSHPASASTLADVCHNTKCSTQRSDIFSCTIARSLSAASPEIADMRLRVSGSARESVFFKYKKQSLQLNGTQEYRLELAQPDISITLGHVDCLIINTVVCACKCGV